VDILFTEGGQGADEIEEEQGNEGSGKQEGGV
jgi:hypothetical protein